nr:MAG TPA: head closure knob [Caudoviricetes sp.]
MADIKNSLGNIAAMAERIHATTNRPAQYNDRRNPYFGDPTARFVQAYGKYASDYTACRVQGLDSDPNNFYEWSDQLIRLADARKKGNAIDRPIDNYKEFLMVDRRIEYVPEGAKMETMGSTWLVTNPANISSAVGGGIIRRCNTTWNHLDWYGNVLKEPMVLESVKLNANANDFQETVLMMQGYFNIIIQRNKETADLDVNSRMILGRMAYQITGYADVAQEFTGDDESCRLLRFTARMTEPDKEKDDLMNRVANAYPFAWEINVGGKAVMSKGEKVKFTAASLRNGEKADGDAEHPTRYLWFSSDESVCRVDAGGNVTAVGEGECTITAVLVQNEEHYGTYAVTVEESVSGVHWQTDPVERLEAYGKTVLTAIYTENGAETGDAVEWTFTGAAEDSYTAEVEGNTATVYCWGGSVNPLTVTASCKGQSVSAEIALEGW